jgi:F-type H+-transporting ATPase subunit b
MAATPLTGLSLAAGGLTDVNLVLTVATVIVFALFAWVLGKFGWGPLLRMIDEREASIRDAVDGSQKANAEAQQLLEQHRQLLRDAGREREEILRKTLGEAEQLKADLSTRARAESEQIVARAREQVEREKAQAIREIRSQVADIAIEAASRIVTSSLTPDAQRQLVDEYIASLPEAPS